MQNPRYGWGNISVLWMKKRVGVIKAYNNSIKLCDVYLILVIGLVYFVSVCLLVVMWCLIWCGVLVVVCIIEHWVVCTVTGVYIVYWESCLDMSPVWCRRLAYFPTWPLISLKYTPFPTFYKPLITNNIYI